MSYNLAMMKTKQVNVRLTEQERSRLAALAREQGFRSLPDYLRTTALAGARPKERSFSVILHPCDDDEGGGYWTDVPALPGCHSLGDDYQEAIEHTREAIIGHVEMLRDHGLPVPEESHGKRGGELTAVVRVSL